MLPDHNIHRAGLDGYASMFEHCRGSSVVLESTPDYLYSDTAVNVLRQIRPIPRVLFVLRRPGSRIYSFYQYARNNMALLPRGLTFQQFLDEIDRPGGGALAGRGTLAMTVAYSDYASYLSPWLDHFPASHIRISLFERLMGDPRTEVQAIASWVNIDPSFFDSYSFPRENAAYEIRAQWLQRLKKAVAVRTPVGGRLKRSVRRAYETVATRPAQGPPPEDSRLIAELEKRFETANARLADLTGLDLSIWSNP